MGGAVSWSWLFLSFDETLEFSLDDPAGSSFMSGNDLLLLLARFELGVCFSDCFVAVPGRPNLSSVASRLRSLSNSILFFSSFNDLE